jgi:hypothetical protein
MNVMWRELAQAEVDDRARRVSALSGRMVAALVAAVVTGAILLVGVALWLQIRLEPVVE